MGRRPHPGCPLLARAVCCFAADQARNLYATRLTLDGAFVLSMRPPPLGVTMSVVLYPLGLPPLPPIGARVIGLRVDPADAAGTGFEIVFTRMDDRAQALLRRAVAELAAAEPDRMVRTVGGGSPRARPAPPAPDGEKRREPRVWTHHDAFIDRPDGPVRLRLLNLSMSGALLAFPGTMPPDLLPGAEVDLVIANPDAPECVSVRAHVVRLAGPGEPPGIGVRFVGLDEVGAGRIEGLLLDALAEEYPNHA